ncbi:patatin-like phospholipase family protein [bacterium]|nr:patatin-like phospholipase family protein [bacterium]
MRILVALIILIGFNVNAQLPKYLVLEGGGIRGLAYSGALETLDSSGVLDEIECIAGTSSGAIAGSLYAIGYEPTEITEIMMETSIQNFNQVGFPLFGGIRRMKKSYGYYSTERFEKTIEKLIEKRGLNPELSFAELHQMRTKDARYKDLYITGTSMNEQAPVIFSYETYPNMKISTALRISISIPLYFEAIFLDSNGTVQDQKTCPDCDIMVDGGVLNNYPIHLFDSIAYDSTGQEIIFPNPYTLGLKLERSDQVNYGYDLAPYQVNNMGDFVGAVYTLSFENLNREHLCKQHYEQTVVIDNLDMNPRVRRIPKKEKQKLIESGRNGAREYLIAVR